MSGYLRAMSMLAGISIVLLLAVSIFYSPSGIGLIPRHCTSVRSAALQTERQAVLAAREIWHCINPKTNPPDEQTWETRHTANLREGVWHVAEVVPEGYAGGG